MKKLIFLFLVLCLGSCASKKEVVYFQDIDQQQFTPIGSLFEHPVIEVNDILKIKITALEPESVLPFEFDKLSSKMQANSLDILKLEGYLVDKQGDINYPQLGKIHIEGLTTQEAQQKMEQKLSQYIKNPTVMLRLVNYKITMIGEVSKPGTYTISEESITLPQALGLAGDLTIKGKRSDVLIIRQSGGKRTEKRIDLTQSDWMNSPYYFLKQNDIVYVEPNNPRVKSAGFIGNLGTVLSVASILLSAAVVIFR